MIAGHEGLDEDTKADLLAEDRTDRIAALEAEVARLERERDALKVNFDRVRTERDDARGQLEGSLIAAEEFGDEMRAVQSHLAELRDVALLAKDALQHNDAFSYGLHVGLIINALIGRAAVGVERGEGTGPALDADLGLRVAADEHDGGCVCSACRDACQRAAEGSGF